jgi:hypothetical protein
MVDESGASTVARLRSPLRTWPGINTVEPEPIAGLEAVMELERAAQNLIADYIRLARETGRSWYEIGDALNLHAAASANKLPVAEEAYDYALRNPVGPDHPDIHLDLPDLPARGYRPRAIPGPGEAGRRPQGQLPAPGRPARGAGTRHLWPLTTSSIVVAAVARWRRRRRGEPGQHGW